MTKKELVAEGKALGLNLKESSLKADLESAVNAAKAKNKPKASVKTKKGEY